MSDALLKQFIQIYQSLDKHNLNTLRMVYSSDVEFEDNLHKLQGIDKLITYFESQYHNLQSCQFIVKEAHRQDENAWLAWDMRFSHPKLQDGNTIEVSGASHLRLCKSVYYHRDYVDMGQVLYEHLPLLGPAIKWIKRRAV